MTRTFSEIIEEINIINSFGKTNFGRTEERLQEIHSLAWELQLKCESCLRGKK
jgi:hypothetical protein